MKDGSCDVLPVYAVDDVVYGRQADAEYPGNGPLPFSLADSPSNSANLIVREFCPATAFASHYTLRARARIVLVTASRILTVLRYLVGYVVGVGSEEQVRRAYTGRVIATMKNKWGFRLDSTIRECPRKAMRPLSPMGSNPKDSVAGLPSATRPFPAIPDPRHMSRSRAKKVHFGPEPFFCIVKGSHRRVSSSLRDSAGQRSSTASTVFGLARHFATIQTVLLIVLLASTATAQHSFIKPDTSGQASAAVVQKSLSTRGEPAKFDRSFWLASSLWLGGSTADLVTTKFALERGGVESNPLHAQDGGHKLRWTSAIAATGGTFAFAAYCERKGHRRVARIVLITGAIVRTGLAFWNNSRRR